MRNSKNKRLMGGLAMLLTGAILSAMGNASYHSVNGAEEASSQTSGYHAVKQTTFSSAETSVETTASSTSSTSSMSSQRLTAELMKQLSDISTKAQDLRSTTARAVKTSAPSSSTGTNSFGSKFNSLIGEFSGESIWKDIQARINLDPNVMKDPEVKRQLKFFTSRPGTLNAMLNNSAPYLYYVHQETKKRNMPGFITLLPMIESDYSPNAYSRTGAAGIWQMMPGTATGYGLNIDWWYDSRRDIVTSTKGALNYLGEMQKKFGDWYLTAASYNAGDGRVRSLMKANKRANKSTDYWSLALPRETKEYVPRLLALAAIIKNPEQYGVTLPNIANKPFFVGFKMRSQMTLDEISRLSGVQTSTIQRLNPGLRRPSTSPDGEYTLLIPTTNSTVFRANLAKVAGKAHMSWAYHEVHNGETIEKIAKNYHTSTTLLASANKLPGTTLQPGQGIMVPMWLNKTFKNPVAISDLRDDAVTVLAEKDPLPSAATVSVSDILHDQYTDTDAEIAQQMQLASNVAQSQPMPQPVTQVSSLGSDPIRANDSLKSVITKIYGRE